MSTSSPLDLDALLPLRALSVRLEFTERTRFYFFHQAAVTGFIKTLLGGYESFDTDFFIDAPESGHLQYEKGDHYCFSVYVLPHCDANLQELLDRLYDLPHSALNTDKAMSLRDNVSLVELRDLLSGKLLGDSIESLQCFDGEALEAEASLWQSLYCDASEDLLWRWLSPVRLLRDKEDRAKLRGELRFCHDDSHLDANLLLIRLFDSTADLLRRRNMSVDPRSAVPAINLIAKDVFWLDTSYADKSGHSKPMGGLTGLLTFSVAGSSDFDLFWWRLLVLAQWLGMGQRRAFGWGRFRLERESAEITVPRTAPACLLLDAAAGASNMQQAWQHIHTNRKTKKRAVVDEELDAFDDDASFDDDPPFDVLERLSRRLGANNYAVAELNGHVITDPDGDLRALAIPPFFDRVVQRAVVQCIQPALELLMSDGSHGYRVGRSRMSARNQIQAAFREGYRWVFESDIQSFFDSVNRFHLRVRLQALYGDDPLVDLLMGWMAAPVNYEGRRIDRPAGIPQGSPLSPVLANLLLDDFDHDVEAAGFKLIRYADDFVILCKDKEQANEAYSLVRESLSELGLQVNEGKTRSISFEMGYRFLGYHFMNDLAIDVGGKKSSGASPSSPKSKTTGWLAQVARHEARELTQSDDLLKYRQRADKANRRVNVGSRDKYGVSVFVTGDSCVLSTRSNRLQLWRDDVKLAEFPWKSLQSVVMFGPHHITSPASRTALYYDVPVHYASSSGKYRGVLWNGEPGEKGHRFWLDQVLLFEDANAVIPAACSLVESRIRHMREVLRQYGKPVEKQRNQMQKSLRNLSSVADLSVLNGVEGSATRAYFFALQQILPRELGFTGRKRRPPPDPFNILLSLGYTMLYQHVESILRSDNLLPWAGLYHQGRGKHAALASDLMEPFRHVVERVAIQMFLRNQLTVDDFTLYPNQRCDIHDSARRSFLTALSERLDQQVVALGDSEPKSIHQHIHAQNLSLIRWVRESKPFSAWRIR